TRKSSVFSVSFPFSIRILFHIILNDKTGSKDLSQSLFVYSLKEPPEGGSFFARCCIGSCGDRRQERRLSDRA
ncbi:MAG: hypothetical protein LKG40_03945, partial [Lachnospiraceae bacterium]|nr:hypothetical protein [Lachnospiraceae bacterium]MCI1328149.1 hypothetical protein [Lachnospiraceae bacterium]